MTRDFAMGALPPEELKWQIGKTADFIVLANALFSVKEYLQTQSDVSSQSLLKEVNDALIFAKCSE